MTILQGSENYIMVVGETSQEAGNLITSSQKNLFNDPLFAMRKPQLEVAVLVPALFFIIIIYLHVFADI